jgi:2-amino-4-hydroxy-6-hydroxymethyldihydropteridine diphosphokinase
MKNIVYLSLGSNVGDRMENIVSLLSLLESSGFINIKQISSFYETSPVGPEQRAFYNIAIKARTDLSAFDLITFIKQAENILGRKKTIRWGPRIIDIDILFFNKEIIVSKNLIVPHKEIQDRKFVLIPLCEIAADIVHPVFKRTVRSILRNKLSILKRQNVIRLK